jgi:hypothetical protein
MYWCENKWTALVEKQTVAKHGDVYDMYIVYLIPIITLYFNSFEGQADSLPKTWQKLVTLLYITLIIYIQQVGRFIG